MATFKNVKENENAVDLNATNLRNDGTIRARPKSLFNDGVNKNRADNKQLSEQARNYGQRLQQPDTTAVSVSDSASAEFNSFNHLKHLKPTCTYKVDYFITAPILTHAASVLRKAAFGDVSEFIKNITDRANKAKEEAVQKIKNKIAKDIELGVSGTTESETIVIPPEQIQYDFLNIPWSLRVPTDREAVVKILNVNPRNLASAESGMADAKLLKDINPSFTIKIESGKDADACPKSVTHKGFKYVGSFIKPLYIPIHPADSYGGMFGKLHAQFRTGSNSSEKVNSISALIINRICVPNKFQEPDGALPVVASLFSDYASIVSTPLIYGNDSVAQGQNADVPLDDVWKKVIASGALFTNDPGIENPPSYSSAGLKKDDIIKHGTDGVTKGELKSQLAEVNTKLTSPFLRRVGLENSKEQKAGGSPSPYEKGKVKDYSKLTTCSVADTLQGVSWDSVVSNRYKNTLNMESIKTGKNFYEITDIPAFTFWAPWITSKAEDPDGSTIYSHLEPENDKSLSSIKVIYTKKAPVALLEAGVTYVPFGSHIYSVDDTDANPGVFVDENIHKYGIGGFGDTSDSKDKYLLPVSNLTKHIFTGLAPVIGSQFEFPSTHKYGKKTLSIHSAVLKTLAKSFSVYSVDAVNSIKDSISISILYSKYKGKKMYRLGDDGLPAVTANVKIGLTDILLFGTSFETTKPEEESLVFVDETQKNLIGPNTDKAMNLGQIGKLIRVDLNNIKNASIHFGKTINQKGIEDNVKLKSSNVKKFLIDSPISSTPITDISSGQKGIITDIQPGEEILQKTLNDREKVPVPKEPTKLNEVQYSISPTMAKSAMYTEDLIDSNVNNRVGALDIIASLMGSGYSDDKATDASANTGKPVTKDIDTLISVALQQGYTALIGKSQVIPKIEPLLVPKGQGYNEDSFNTFTGNAYKYFTGIPENQLGIFSSLAFLLFSPETFYLEHFEDVKKDRMVLNNVIFYSGKKADGLYGLLDEEIQRPGWLDVSDVNDIKAVNVIAANDDPSSKYTPELVTIKVPVSTSSYSPWASFEDGKEDYLSRINKFSFLSPVDNENLRKSTSLILYTDNLVNAVEKFISAKTGRNDSPNYFLSAFTSGEFAITDTNIVQKLTSLIAHDKFENIHTQYPGSNEKLMKAVFQAIGKKSIALSLESSVVSLKKIKDSAQVYGNFIKYIAQKKNELAPLVAGKQYLPESKIQDLIETLEIFAEKMFVNFPTNEADKFLVAKIFLYACACVFIKNIFYAKEDAGIVGIINQMNADYRNNTADSSSLPKIPRYETVSLAPLGELIEAVQSSNKGQRDYRELTRLYKECRLLFVDWYAEMQDTSLEFNISDNGIGLGRGTPYTKFAIPKQKNLRVPIGIVSKAESSEDRDRLEVYEFPGNESSLKLDEFARDLKSGKYELLVKKMDIKWLDSNFLSGEVSIDRISNSAKNACILINLIDYIGFTLQAMLEVEKVRESLGPNTVTSDPLNGRQLNRLIRKKKIELGSEFMQDDSPEFEGSGIRRYLVKLTDFSNMVSVKEVLGSPLITKMFPLGLKDLDPDKQDISLEDKDIVEPKTIDLTGLTSSTTSYIGMFLRPGYGLPDFAQKVGYRCKIEEVSSVLYGKFKPKRYAFFGLFKENQASLKLSRMIQSASGEKFTDLVKSSDWTSARLQDKETIFKGQLSSFDLNPKYKSSYDGFVPKGMKGTILFDVEIGYLSSRPLFSTVINLTAPPITTKLLFGGVIDSVNLQYKSGFPINMVGRLLTGTTNTPNAKSKDTGLYGAFIRMVNANKEKSLPEAKKTVLNFSMLSMFRIPKELTKEDMTSLDSLVSAKSFTPLKDKVVALIKDKKLRDSSFDPSSQFCFNGRVFENPIPGSSPYPVFYPGASTQKVNYTPSISDYKSIEKSGISNESLYDLHPLSFLTSPTFIGLSKRRSLLTGSYILSHLIKSKDTVFVKKTGAKNPYAGIYYTKLSIEHNNVAVESGRDLSTTKNTRVVVIPDFPETKVSAASNIKTEYGLDSSDVSDQYLAEFFGTGAILNGKFIPPGSGVKESLVNNPIDSSAQTSSDYKEKSTELFTSLLEHLKLWNDYAKTVGDSETEFYSALNGCFFYLPGATSGNETVISKVTAPNYSKMVGKTTITFTTDKDRQDFISSISAVFPGQTKVPVALQNDIFYFTASAITFISLFIKKRKGEKSKITPKDSLKFTNMLAKIEETTDQYWKTVIPYFKRMDLFAIMAGGRYNFSGNPLAVDTFTGGYSAFTSYEKTGVQFTEDSSNFVAAQSYMGYSTDGSPQNNIPVQLAVTKGTGGREFLTPTRTFGKDVKLKDIIQNGLEYKYMAPGPSIEGVGGKNKTGNANAKLMQMAKPVLNTLPLLYNTHAFNIFLIARLWLAYNWYSEKFKQDTLTVSGSENPVKIEDVTLYNLTTIDISYFVKNVGPVLRSTYSKLPSSQGTFNLSEITDSANFLNPVFSMSNGRKVVSAMYKGSVTPSPSIRKATMGIAGILKTSQVKSDLGNGTLPVKDNDLLLDTESMSALWSLFSMKVFVGTDSTGVEVNSEELINNVAAIKNAPGDPKPSLGAIDGTKSKIYTDMAAADKSKGNDNFITIIKENGDTWGYVTYSANNDKENFHESAAETEITVAEKYKSKTLVYKNGISVQQIYKED